MKSITRAEVAIAAGVLIVIASLVGSIFYGVRLNRIRSMVQSDFKAVEDALLAYEKEYNQLPTLYGEYFDFRYGLDGDVSNNEVINALQAVDGAGNEKGATNAKRIQYIKIPKAGWRLSGLNDEGVFVDPWGNPYQMVLDTDGNEVCAMEDTPYDRAVGKRIAMWSIGPDGKLYTWDDMLSWQ